MKFYALTCVYKMSHLDGGCELRAPVPYSLPQGKSRFQPQGKSRFAPPLEVFRCPPTAPPLLNLSLKKLNFNMKKPHFLGVCNPNFPKKKYFK